MCHVLVAHALAEGANCPEQVGMGVSRNQRVARADQSVVNREMSTDAGVNVKDPDAVFPGKEPALLLVGRVLLVRAAGIAVEREEGFSRVHDAKPVVLQVLHHVRAAEVAGDAEVDCHISDVARLDLAAAVSGKDFLDYRPAHAS